MIYLIFALSALFVLPEIRSLFIICLRLLRHRSPPKSVSPATDDLPSVTVQLPVYREQMVLRRLLSSVLNLDYPPERLTVQVIDNSEEREARLTEEIVGEYQKAEVKVIYLHRADRSGYKSGNLNYGLRRVTSELVAIFDADCVPSRDFLRRIVPYFRDDKTGAVQARWGYLNDTERPLNTMQAAVLDTLFCFENDVRGKMGLSGFFLGSGGVWRKKTIDDLGGWQEVPFTAEDFDLSYRARLGGWFVAYEENALLKCELPNTYLSYKSQQRRWSRSCFRVLIDHLPHISRGGWSGLLEVTLLLRMLGMQMLIPLIVLISAYIILGLPRSKAWLVSQLGLTAVMAFSPTLLELVISQKLLYRDWLRRTISLLRAVPLAIGLSITLFAGFCDTLFDSGREWAKTLRPNEEGLIGGSQRRWLLSAVPICAAELLFGLLAIVGLVFAVRGGYWESWLLLILLANGFLISAWTSASELHTKLKSKQYIGRIENEREENSGGVL